MGYRLPLITTVGIALLMIVGGLVVGMNAGFACPDWPKCNGQWIPPLEGTVIVEYIHRLVSSVVGMLIIATLFFAWRKHRHDRLIRRFSLLSLLLLVAIATAGALIVVWVLPGAFTTIDVTLSMMLLAAFVVLTVAGLRSDESMNVQRTKEEDKLYQKAYYPGLIVAGATFFEVFVGALFRHSGAGEALFGKNDYLLSHQQYTMPSAVISNTMLIFHIIMGVLVMGSVFWMLAHARKNRVLMKPIIILTIATGLQIILGVTTLATELELVIETLHWTVAIFLVGMSVYIAARARLIDYVPVMSNQKAASSSKKPALSQ